jgi:hypothetical protein
MAFDPLSSDFIESSIHHQKESLELIQSLKPRRTTRNAGVEKQARVPKVRFFMSKELKDRIKTLKDRQISENIVIKICDSLLSIRKVPENSINYLGLSNDDFSKISYLSPDRKERVAGKTFIDKYITPISRILITYESEINLRQKDGSYIAYTNKMQSWMKFPTQFFSGNKQVKMKRKKVYVNTDENGVSIFTDEYFIPDYSTLSNLGRFSFDLEGNLGSNYTTNKVIDWMLCDLKSETVDSCWDHNMRHHQSIHKILTKLLGDQYTEREKNFFSEQYFKLVVINNPNTTLKFVKGEELIKYYDARNYLHPMNSSTLWNSCMRYEHTLKYLEFYNELSQVELAVLLFKKAVVARCLIWKVNGECYYDRIYFYNDQYEAMTESLLVNSGFQPIRNSNIAGSSMANIISIPLSSHKFYSIDYYPYLDSLRYYSEHEEILTNDNDYSDCIVLDHTDGSYTNNDNSDECGMCGRETDADELYEIEYGMNRGTCGCSRCVVFSEVHDCYIDRQYTAYCTYSNTAVCEDEMVELNNGNFCHNEYPDLREYENGFGYFVLSDSSEYIEIDGSYYHPEDADIPKEEEEDMEEEVEEITVSPNEVNSAEEIQLESSENLDILL